MTNGDIYIWEPESNRGYSIGWNLKTLKEKGLPEQEQPKTSDELLHQITELIKKTGTEWGGPATINSLDNYLASYLEEEKPSRQGFTDQIQSFLEEIKEYDVVISLDLIPRQGLCDSVNGQMIIDAVNDVIQTVYESQMVKGVFKPQILINLFPETDWESKSLDGWLRLAYLYGYPTFQNFITGTINPESTTPRTYTPDKEVTYLRVGGVNGNSENQAVTGYACINLAKIGEEAIDEEEFLNTLEKQVYTASDSLSEKNKKIEKAFNDGEMPLTSHLMDNLDWGFNVITLAGMNEALETLIDAPIGHVAGKAVTYKVLEHLLRLLEDIQEETDTQFSLESYPSETPASTLLTEYESTHKYLTPATELKPSHGDDLWDALEHQKKYHSMYTGGTLTQIHLAEGLDYNEGLRLLVKRTLKTFGYNYLAVTPVFSICNEHGYVYGEQSCPVCGAETDTYTRVDNRLIKLSELTKPQMEAYQQRVNYDVKNR